MVRIAPDTIHVAPLEPLPPWVGRLRSGQVECETVDLDAFGPESLDEVLNTLEARSRIPWLRSSDHAELDLAARRCGTAGGDAAAAVLECPPTLVSRVVGDQRVVAVCPDDLGAAPGGPLEAVVTRAVVDGARIVRSVHHREAQRCMHVTAALILERRGEPV